MATAPPAASKLRLVQTVVPAGPTATATRCSVGVSEAFETHAPEPWAASVPAEASVSAPPRDAKQATRRSMAALFARRMPELLEPTLPRICLRRRRAVRTSVHEM